jgi:tRNA(Ile)-lysidine synthase
MSLPHRFRENLRSLGIGRSPEHLLIAVSGGCDSMVLLHLLRFAVPALPLTLTVAHLDHAMREGSEADARWLAGVCAAWGLPLIRRRLAEPPRGEEAAREARYAFLREAAREAGASWVVTAHQADDQAETVLFRVLRGTGIAGLRGIPARTRSGLLRPLLPFWREELEGYAREAGLRWRTDPSNLVAGPARNRLRLQLLPQIEREVAPGARRNLVSLADLAREAEAEMERRTADAGRALVSLQGGAAVLARAGLRDYDSALGARILRQLLRRFGVVLGRTGTRTALQFITDAPSGREMQLPGGVRIRLEFDEARFERARRSPPDRPLRITAGMAREAGEGSARVGGRRFRAAWRTTEAADGEWRVALDPTSLHFPLVLRGWRPGDRVRTPGGTKTLKKLFVERRVRRGERSRLPVLVDARGSVLWVVGVDRAGPPAPPEGAATLFLTLSNVRFQADPGADRGA